VCDAGEFHARCSAFEPKMSQLAVSNDVLRESLRVAAAPPLSTKLEQYLSAWFPTFERRLIDLLYWFTDRAPWQRGAISVGVGALLGLGIVFVGAAVFGWQRTELGASAASEAVLLAPAPVRGVAPVPTIIAPVPPPAAVVAPVAAAAEPPQEQIESRPTSRHAKKRHLRRRAARSTAGTWRLPHPQRRSR
jgi:hypothetical protein